jgi:ribonuclease P protein component
MAILRGERAESERSRNANAVNECVSDTPKGSFPKTAHLLKHSDFQKVYQQGRRHFSGNLTVFYLRAQTEAAPEPNQAGTAQRLCAPGVGRVRIGFTVSKALGGSVERNRMRRRTREAVRRHLGVLHGISDLVDVVINPKKSLLAAEFQQISQEIERAFCVIRQHCDRMDRTAGRGANDGTANRAADKRGKREARQG